MNLSIKNVPVPVVDKLRQRAARNHRSLQGELMALVNQAVESEREGIRPIPPTVRGTKSIEQIAAEHRSRWNQPFGEGPTAADLIRADRDVR